MRWRLILDRECDPYWNMAVDSAIFESVISGDSQPTVRLYRWIGAAVTIGRFQDAERGLNLEYCAGREIPVIRRPTGGRGILHGGDQTVSVAAREEAVGCLGLSIAESYRRLSEGYVRAFLELGVRLTRGKCEKSQGVGDCFAFRSAADLIASDTREKLVGSAQRRRDGAILMQSSIRLGRPDIDPECVFRGRVSDSTYSLAGIGEEQLEGALVRGFGAALDASIEPAGLTAMERAAAEREMRALKTGILP